MESSRIAHRCASGEQEGASQVGSSRLRRVNLVAEVPATVRAGC